MLLSLNNLNLKRNSVLKKKKKKKSLQKDRNNVMQSRIISWV